MSLNARADAFGRTRGSEYLNAIDSTTADTLTIPAQCGGALVSVIGAEPIKWRTDGVDPTYNIGHPLAPGGHLELFFDDMVDFAMICGTQGQTTDVFVTYYGEK